MLNIKIAEQWRWIPGYYEYYMVSDQGRVKSVDRYVNNAYGTKSLKRGKILAQATAKDGNYKFVNLQKNGIGKPKTVHVLVLLAFDGPCPSNKNECRHLDGNPANNWLYNLVWGTYKQQARDKRRHGRQPTILTKKQVIYIKSHPEFNTAQLSIKFKVDRSTISHIQRGNWWKHIKVDKFVPRI